MVDIKEAVATAKTYVEDLYSGEQIKNVGLEEVEFDDQKRFWLVTVGLTRVTPANDFVSALGGTPQRLYKMVTINDSTGKALSMRDREFSH